MDIMNQVQSVIHEHTGLEIPIDENIELDKLNISIETQHHIRRDLTTLTGVHVHFNTPTHGSTFHSVKTLTDYIIDMLARKGK